MTPHTGRPFICMSRRAKGGNLDDVTDENVFTEYRHGPRLR